MWVIFINPFSTGAVLYARQFRLWANTDFVLGTDLFDGCSRISNAVVPNIMRSSRHEMLAVCWSSTMCCRPSTQPLYHIPDVIGEAAARQSPTPSSSTPSSMHQLNTRLLQANLCHISQDKNTGIVHNVITGSCRRPAQRLWRWSSIETALATERGGTPLYFYVSRRFIKQFFNYNKQ